MGLYKRKNIMWGALRRLFMPDNLWTRRFTVAWLGSIATLLVFNIMWCGQTTFRAMSFPGTYVNAIAGAFLMSLPAMLSKRSWLQTALMLIVDAVMISNLMYCRTYFNSIPLASYGLIGNVIDFTASIFDSFSWYYLLLPLIAVITARLMHSHKHETKPALAPFAATTLAFGLLSWLVSLPYGGVTQHVSTLKGECYYATTPPVIYTIAGTLIAEAMNDEAVITTEQKNAVDLWLADQARFENQTGKTPDSLESRDNLVVIVCESLESWAIGAKPEGKELTPTLNKLIADTTTWYAGNVLSQVGNGRSIDGQLLMLAGMYPMRNFVYSMKFASNRYHAIPEAMKATGAKTYLLSGDKPSTWNQGLVAAAFGVDRMEMNDTWDNSERIGNPRRLSDKSLISQSIGKMKSGKVWREGEKAYVQMVTYTCHNPFRIPEEHQTIHLEGKYPDRLRDYMTAVHYTDSAIGTFIEYLRSRSDWQRTMVVIVGDHEALASWRGELLADSTGAELVSPEGYVPLIILNAPLPGNRSAVMGQVDVYSTIADQMQLPVKWRGMGFSALSPDSPKFAFDYNGRLIGDTTGVNPGLIRHIDNARNVSDIIIKYNLLE